MKNVRRGIRGVFKKFAAQPRRKMNFTTERGVRDVTLLKRSLTQPLPNRSCCFAQAVDCCKNVCYFCRTHRRSARSSDSICGVTEKCRKGYPWRLVGNTGGILSSLQECQSEDWALQSWSTEHWRWPSQRSSTSSSVWRNVEEVGHLIMNELQCRSETSQRKCTYMMHPPKQLSFGISICSACSWRRMPKCQIQNKGKFVRRRLVMLWTSPEDLHTRFLTHDETRVPHLVPESKTESHQWNHPAPRSPKKKRLWSQPARWWWQCSRTMKDFWASTSWIMALTWTGNTMPLSWNGCEQETLRKDMARCQKMCVCSGDNARAHQRSAAINKAVDCGSKMLPHLTFFMDLAPLGSNLLPNMKKTLESYVSADNEEMITSVMNMQDMLEIFFFKECLRVWVKSCDKFGNMNDDDIDQQTFFVFKSSFYLCSFMVGPRTFWTPLVKCDLIKMLLNDV